MMSVARAAPVPCLAPIFDQWEPPDDEANLLVWSVAGLACGLRLQS